VSRKRLGKYEIIDRIGRGGMAEVYRGYHAALDRYVAIKLLHPFLADDPEFKDRFENEARNVARLKHPNIVQVYDFEYDTEGDSYYMVMEMINGPTLKDRLFDLDVSGDTLPISEAIRVIRDSAEALAYAHQRNMIHRDVKPANLMLDEDGRVVLTDFGIAKIVVGAQFTASGGMVGTPAYMAPEQGLGEAGDERSDIYSLGVILYQLVTGRLPYDADTPLAIILKHVNEALPPPKDFVPDLADDLEQIIRKSLEKEPVDRYQTAIAFAQDLSLLDENGVLRIMIDQATGLPVNGIPSPFDTKPAPPTPAQRAMLAAAGERVGIDSTQALQRPLAQSTNQAPASPYETTPQPPNDSLPSRPSGLTLPAPGAPGRLRPGGVIGLSLAIVVLVALALFGFGSDDTPLAGVFGADDTATATPNFTQTAVAMQLTQQMTTTLQTLPPTETTEPTLTPTLPTDTPNSTPTPGQSEVSPSPAPTQPPITPTLTATRSPSLTLLSTDTPPPTSTASPTMTLSPTPNLTATAISDFFETQVAASPTPNLTQTLTACDFEYIVVAPNHYNQPPAATDASNPRLIQASNDFEIEIVFQNTGTCGWPDGVRLRYNGELTENPTESVNLAPLREVCAADEIRAGLNLAQQEQSNFYLTGAVAITEESEPITFLGSAPNVFGCYYSVWDLLYPNSDYPMGRPFVLTIRVWGGG
jgi:serine/threonine protein kinase